MHSGLRTLNTHATYSRNAKFRDRNTFGQQWAWRINFIEDGVNWTNTESCVHTIAIKTMQKNRDYWKIRRKTMKSKQRRAQLRNKKYRLYDQKREAAAGTSDYVKDQNTYTSLTMKEHSYAIL